jgi:hypothetical protein
VCRGRVSQGWALILLALVPCFSGSGADQGASAGCFRIRVVDEQSGRGVGENLNRGLVALRSAEVAYLSWRLLRSDPVDLGSSCRS